MEPLEKVVKALEICGKADPSLCPYFDTKHWGCCTGHIQGYSPVKDDAYSYLREYLNYQKSQKMVNKSDNLSDTENKPLDWEELKSMVGKPVWMEDDTGTKFYRGWAIVLDFKFSNGNYLHYVCDNYSETCVDVEDIGKTWIAYKQERK